MSDIEIRNLKADEVEEARQLSNRNPDIFTAYALKHLPCFFEIADSLTPLSVFLAKQRLVIGAFNGNALIGAVFVETVNRLADLETSETLWKQVQENFSESEIDEYCKLVSDWSKALIGAPNGALSIHSLCVAPKHRGQGIASKLLAEAINNLSDEEHSLLYIEVANVRGHVRHCESLGFQIVRKRFSLPVRIQYGCWGTALLEFAQS